MSYVAGALLLAAAWLAFDEGDAAIGAVLCLLAIGVLLAGAAERDRRV